MKQKRILSVLLSAAMCLSLLTGFASAASEEAAIKKNIALGVSALEGAQKSNVYFGNYKQSSNNNGGYNIDPIKWRVLDTDNDYDRNAVEGETDITRSLFLLADQNLDVFQYNTASVSVTWETGTMRSWLNGYDSTKNGQSKDYTSDNFIKTAFSEKELAYIPQTKLENADNPDSNTEGGRDTDDYVFLLSIAEVLNTAYGFTADTKNTDTRVSTDTAYVAAGGKLGTSMIGVGKADYWWLRSPGNGEKYAAEVANGGSVDKTGSLVLSPNRAVRPAFNLDSSSVLFSSAAEEGKSGAVSATLGTNEAITNADYKLTLKDSARTTFALSDTTAKIAKTGDTLSFGYTGATTGENEYISAMIVKDNDVLYYAPIAKAETGNNVTANVMLPSELESGEYELRLFNEQINGNCETDFSSGFQTVALTIENPTFSISEVNVSDTTTTATVSLPKSGEYQLILADYTGDALSQVKIVPITATTDNATVTTEPIAIVLGEGDKVLLWNGFSELKPLCEVYIVQS